MLMQSFAVLLAPGSVGHIANIVKGYAIAIGVVFAIWFVWQWWRTRMGEMALERATRAKEAWRRHLVSALQQPELAEPMLGALSSPIESARYRTFVASLLATADEILALEPSDGWRETLGRSLRAHSSYLRSAEFRDAGLRDCSEEVRALIDRVSGR
jgi:hypothetical protein